MSAVLVRAHTGPSVPAKAAPGCAVAGVAAAKGHEVTVFIAGDGTHALAAEHRETLQGVGTGSRADRLSQIVGHRGRFGVSGVSARARGHDHGLPDGRPAAVSMPAELVDPADAADSVPCH